MKRSAAVFLAVVLTASALNFTAFSMVHEGTLNGLNWIANLTATKTKAESSFYYNSGTKISATGSVTYKNLLGNQKTVAFSTVGNKSIKGSYEPPFLCKITEAWQTYTVLSIGQVTAISVAP